jgi:hypothetical protein
MAPITFTRIISASMVGMGAIGLAALGGARCNQALPVDNWSISSRVQQAAPCAIHFYVSDGGLEFEPWCFSSRAGPQRAGSGQARSDDDSTD